MKVDRKLLLLLLVGAVAAFMLLKDRVKGDTDTEEIRININLPDDDRVGNEDLENYLEIDIETYGDEHEIGHTKIYIPGVVYY